LGVLLAQCGPGVVAAIAITTALSRRRWSGRHPDPATWPASMRRSWAAT